MLEALPNQFATPPRGATPEVTARRDEIGALCAAIGGRIGLMEVCGTHTVSLFRSGVRSMLPGNLRLISGPGCPVCVTSQGDIDAAIELADRPGVIITTYGDMLRVPGQSGSLEERRAQGADVRVVSSARRALRVARENPDREVVFLAVGFETTAPATAAVVRSAAHERLGNFSVLVSHKLVVPAMQALLADGSAAIDGFLCPGHVSVIIGADAYRCIVRDYAKPCVVAGFEPIQMLRGISHLLRQIHAGDARLENVYSGVVSSGGNPLARALLAEVFTVTAARWRELGEIADSGLALAPAFAEFDAAQRFDITIGPECIHPACVCGSVIQGKTEPHDCAMFGTVCTPLTPLGPCMVSSEGTCAAWFHYGRAVSEDRSWRIPDKLRS